MGYAAPHCPVGVPPPMPQAPTPHTDVDSGPAADREPDKRHTSPAPHVPHPPAPPKHSVEAVCQTPPNNAQLDLHHVHYIRVGGRRKGLGGVSGRACCPPPPPHARRHGPSPEDGGNAGGSLVPRHGRALRRDMKGAGVGAGIVRQGPQSPQTALQRPALPCGGRKQASRAHSSPAFPYNGPIFVCIQWRSQK